MELGINYLSSCGILKLRPHDIHEPKASIMGKIDFRLTKSFDTSKVDI